MRQESILMPRRLRNCPSGFPVHIIQRGNNRQAIFSSDRDLAAYAMWLAEGSEKYDLKIHGWVFMTNHVHLLVTPVREGSVSRLMQFVGRQYVRYFNHTYCRTGTLFEGRFRSCLVEQEEYLLTCLRYIEFNPVRAGMVRDPGDYVWSSYRAHGLGTEIAMWSPHGDYLILGTTARDRCRVYRQLMCENMDVDLIARIRHCTNTGLVLGTKRFRDDISKLTG